VSARAILLLTGAVFEFGGIVLLGFPDFIPGARLASRWLGDRSRMVAIRGRRVMTRIRARFRTEHRSGASRISGAGTIETAGEVTTPQGIHPDVPDVAKLAFLIRREEEMRSELADLEKRTTSLETKVPRQLAELRRDLRAHVGDELRVAFAAYRPLRVAGTIAFAIGLTLATLGNFA